MDTPDYLKFYYGFIYNSAKGFGESYHVRSDRVMYDWMFEPVPDEDFVNRQTKVKLPEGYFHVDGRLYFPSKFAWAVSQKKKIQTEVNVYQEAPVFSKALVLMMGSLGLSKWAFDKYELPEERIFHLQNPHG